MPVDHLSKNSRVGRLKFLAFALFPSAVVASTLCAVWWWASPRDATARGKKLNQLAWDQTYLERGLEVPATGPRDGYWGERIVPKAPHPNVGWTEPPRHLPDIVEIDQDGMQRYLPKTGRKHHVLLIGGSVAFGTYASGTKTTYFHLVGERLEAMGLASEVTVFAAGAWKSVQDYVAFAYFAERFGPPDLVVFINGLNDLTNGANFEALHGEITPTKDGSLWTMQYHEHDYAARVTNYLKIMDAAVTLAKQHKTHTLLVLQPALFERTPRSRIEHRLLEQSLIPHRSDQVLLESYEEIRAGLNDLVDDGHVSFLDCSRVFNGVVETTFTDMWHFSDVGHEILADAMAPVIGEILRSRR